ncbi:hypothetical protein HK100_002677 [Physocladia obscura]|uniref:Uncharacterized protein n=1 Tax=Physocladia obscura TaxID=109957 RepID=A0AAD5SV19_9FUNG|nr:hypothetical protein HK100_002677 [Physocladia obscura]
MTKHVLVYGGAGSVGTRVVQRFLLAGWHVTSADVRANGAASASVTVGSSLEESHAAVLRSLASHQPRGSLDAIVNVAGGWAGGNLQDHGECSASLVARRPSLMNSRPPRNVAGNAGPERASGRGGGARGGYAAGGRRRAGARGGACADAALAATPAMVAYGLAKAAVHQLVKSIAAEHSGFPAKATVVGLLPNTLDTLPNRAAMPTADYKDWTPLDSFADRILALADKKFIVQSGALIRVVSKSGKTEYLPI